jgi:hypothetical protein
MIGRRTGAAGGRRLWGALAALAIAGCALDEAPLPPNQPPRTYLAVRGDSLGVHPYRAVLTWWGTDLDGRVAGYLYQWDGPWRPAPGDSLWAGDPSWVFTAATIDTFDVPVRGEYAERTFCVRAVDDQGLVDPAPPRQLFRLSNHAPRVAWSDPTRHPTLERPSLPAVSFAWTPDDGDGKNTIAFARLWLDTVPGEDSAAAAVTVARDTLGAFFPEHFGGRYGVRTAHLQIFDDADTGSNILEWTWTVVPPAGDYLLIDNAGGPVSGPQRTDDQFWRDRMQAAAPGGVHVLDVAVDGVFRSRAEVLPLLSLFRGVVWYGGLSFDGSAEGDAQLREGLQLARESLQPYVAGGGRLLLTAHNLFGTEGSLPPEFYHDVLGVETVHTHVVEDERPTDFLVPRNLLVRCGAAFGGVDSLRVNSPLKNTDLFRPSAALEPLLWFEPATLDTLAFPDHARERFYIAALARAGDGKLAFCTTVLTRFRDGGAGAPDAGVNALLEALFHAP